MNKKGYFEWHDLLLVFVIVQVAMFSTIVIMPTIIPQFFESFATEKIILTEDDEAILRYQQETEAVIAKQQEDIIDLKAENEILERTLANVNYSDEMGMALWFACVFGVWILFWRWVSKDDLRKENEKLKEEIEESKRKGK